ncbi:hypothetical protein BDY17DRAFT_40617 [Neohortaea acidophila]|uniref:Uncharacterized protein n=1 Tax=Neohortaea acidophila TaxID=245834 RepID=A0A6A6PIA6_9PEZI|nr:uncharacterized protein BDY17DRAFT_40617 [Neohortaea acidophila]KAF2479526.1 hypothetical protein BDY17DRAFT_40617 [Neohortaea acidophila]
MRVQGRRRRRAFRDQWRPTCSTRAVCFPGKSGAAWVGSADPPARVRISSHARLLYLGEVSVYLTNRRRVLHARITAARHPPRPSNVLMNSGVAFLPSRPRQSTFVSWWSLGLRDPTHLAGQMLSDVDAMRALCQGLPCWNGANLDDLHASECNICVGRCLTSTSPRGVLARRHGTALGLPRLPRAPRSLLTSPHSSYRGGYTWCSCRNGIWLCNFPTDEGLCATTGPLPLMHPCSGQLFRALPMLPAHSHVHDKPAAPSRRHSCPRFASLAWLQSLACRHLPRRSTVAVSMSCRRPDFAFQLLGCCIPAGRRLRHMSRVPGTGCSPRGRTAPHKAKHQRPRGRKCLHHESGCIPMINAWLHGLLACLEPPIHARILCLGQILSVPTPQWIALLDTTLLWRGECPGGRVSLCA